MKSVWIISALLLVPVAAQSVEAPFKYNGFGYGFYSYGGAESVALPIGFGAGAEGFLWRGLAAGFEAAHQTRTVCAQCGITTATGIVAYHFTPRNRARVADPFVSMSIGGATNFASAAGVAGYGGGVNLWLHRRIGVRFEVRGLSAFQGGDPLAMIRFGVTFR